MVKDPKLIDLKKYKRIFTFGCSFTAWWWPTWAEVIHYESPQAEFYNLGKSSVGNQFISIRLSEAARYYNFNQDDLICIMWSTFFREDRYYQNDWHFSGPIMLNLHEYGEKWHQTCDLKGYLIRDINLIRLTNGFLNSLKSDSVMMLSVPFTEYQEVLSFHKDLVESLPRSLLELEMNNKWEWTHEYKNGTNDPIKDYHPSTLRYRNYLEKIGFNLSELSLDPSLKADNLIKTAEDRNEFGIKLFGSTHDRSLGTYNTNLGTNHSWY